MSLTHARFQLELVQYAGFNVTNHRSRSGVYPENDRSILSLPNIYVQIDKKTQVIHDFYLPIHAQ
ncbi:hypothetical protein [Nostoc sp. DSM 114160]